jgi:peptidoglycan/xylan/chitin deacetylase (PgdA/CDA1 family)
VRRALILVYHDIAPGRGELRFAPELFTEHLDCLLAAGATPMTVSAFARGLADGRLPELAVCVTFDDGFASVVDEAAPRLLARRFPATVFCVAGYLGQTNDWPSQPRRIERRPLASARSLAELAAVGFELGSHGYEHARLAGVPSDVLRRELVAARLRLEELLGVRVESFAYPYGAVPIEPGLVRSTYAAACTTASRLVTPADDVFELPRVVAHHVRHPWLLREVLAGRAIGYLPLRRAATRVRGLGARGR